MGVKKVVLKEPQPHACQQCSSNKECTSQCEHYAERFELIEGKNMSWSEMLEPWEL